MSYMNVGFTTCLHYVYNMTLVICNMEALVKSLVLQCITDILFTCIQMYCIGPFVEVITPILFSFSISLFSPVLYYFLSYPYLSAVIPDIMLNICMIFLCSLTEFALFLCLSKVYFIICSPFKTENHD